MTSKLIPCRVQCGKVCMGVERMQSDKDMGSVKCVQLCMRVYNSRRVVDHKKSLETKLILVLK